MKAIQCNRCGKFQTTTSELPYIEHNRSVIKINAGPDDNIERNHTIYFDLCEDCTKDVIEFVTNGKNETE